MNDRHPRFAVRILQTLGAMLAALAMALPAAAQDGSAKVQLTAEAQQAAQRGPIRVIVMLEPTQVPATATQAAKINMMRAGSTAQADGVLARANARRVAGGAIERRVFRRYSHLPYIAMELSAAEAAALAADPSVTAIVEDQIYKVDLDVSVPLVNAPGAWALGHEGGGASVAILDSGVDHDHSMLAGKIIASACFSSTTGAFRTTCPNGTDEQIGGRAGDDCTATLATGCDHGTHAAGIAAGRAVGVATTPPSTVDSHQGRSKLRTPFDWRSLT